MGVVGAIVGSAVLGTAGQLIGGSMASDAAQQSAQVQADAAKYSANIQAQIYNQTRNDLNPFTRLGTGAINNLSSLIPGGLSLPPGTPSNVLAGTTTSPGTTPSNFVDGVGYVTTGPDGQVSVSQTDPNAGADGTAGPPPFQTTPQAPSQFLTNLQSLSPGSGTDPSLGALNSLSPGAANPDSLVSAVNSFIPGASDKLNPLTSSLYNFVPGGSSTPDASLAALKGFIPGGGAENSVTSTLQGLLGAPKYSAADAKALISQYKDDVKSSGLSEGDYLKTPQGQSFVAQRNQMISGLNDPEALRTFQSGALDGAALATQRLADLSSGKAATDASANIQSMLEATPGYEFTKTQGLKAVQNAAAAKGLGGSGAALRGVADYVTGLANSTYEQRLGDYLNSYNSQSSNVLNTYNSQFGNTLNAADTQFTNAYNAYGQRYNNALNTYSTKFTNAYNQYGQQLGAGENLVNLGENAAAKTGAIGAQQGASIGNTLTSGAAAQAAGIVGSTNATTNALTGGLGQVGGAGLSAALFNSNNSAISSLNPSNSLSLGGLPGAPALSPGMINGMYVS